MTTKFNEFTKQNLTNLRKELDAVLAKYGAEANLDIVAGNMRFFPGEVTITVTAKVVGGKSKQMEALEHAMSRPVWDKMGKFEGNLGDFIDLKNEKGDELIGYNSKKYSKPFIFKSGQDGKSYVADENYVKHYFKKKA
jgi:hypothetical protein